MKTSATNKRIRELITGIRNKTMIPRPEFQRRLVWTTKDKRRFLDSVLRGFPFPEIYTAAGAIDPDTGDGTELLVDGQQRVTTLYHYFTASPELDLGRDIRPYAQLSNDEKLEFLEYLVVVRDLGSLNIDQIKEVFERINATKYSLNDMEIHNARFAGEFKKFAESVSQNPFFDKHRIFSANEIRRMSDVGFSVTLIITIMSTYFNRDDEFESYLNNYNDEFDLKEELLQELQKIFDFVEDCNLGDVSRAWKKSDLLTLLVELHRTIIKSKFHLESDSTGDRLRKFYEEVDNRNEYLGDDEHSRMLIDYAKASSQATNDRSSRIKRGEIINKILQQV